MTGEKILGIDIGGSGIKGAIVDIDSGELITERFRVPTPQPATPKAVAKAVVELVDHFQWKGLIGCGFPSVVKNGVAMTAANIDKKWIGTNIGDLLSEATNCKVIVRNDADVAGIAEMVNGAGKGKKGVVIVLTIGTGIGSSVFLNGNLLPNTELGHVLFKGNIAEKYVADSVRKKKDLSWEEWGNRFNEYLEYLQRIFTPDLIILGGGASKKFEKFNSYLSIECPVIPAKFKNRAGIIGAAASAALTASKIKSLS